MSGELVPIREVMDRFGLAGSCGRRQLVAWVDAGRIPPFIQPGGSRSPHVYFWREDLNLLGDEHGMRARPERRLDPGGMSHYLTVEQLLALFRLSATPSARRLLERWCDGRALPRLYRPGGRGSARCYVSRRKLERALWRLERRPGDRSAIDDVMHRGVTPAPADRRRRAVSPRPAADLTGRAAPARRRTQRASG